MHAGQAIARAKDQRIYAAMCAAAEAGARAPTADQLCELLDEDGSGGPSISGTVLMLRRLEQRGLIRIRRFQRYREVQIVATGKWTAAAPCRTPHWRDGLMLTTANV